MKIKTIEIEFDHSKSILDEAIGLSKEEIEKINNCLKLIFENTSLPPSKIIEKIITEIQGKALLITLFEAGQIFQHQHIQKLRKLSTIL